MSHPEFLILILFVGLCLFLLFKDSPAKVVKSFLRRQNITPIEKAKEGELVRVRAKVVVVGKTLVATLSKRDCVYYSVKISDGGRRRLLFEPAPLITETRVTDIVVFDGKHYAVVNKHKLVANVFDDHLQHSGFFEAQSEELQHFLNRYRKGLREITGFPLHLHADEGILEAGETIHISGVANWLPAAQFKHLKLPCDKVLYLDAAEEKGVYLTDEEVG